ncbi:hypothetical protein AB0I98_03390 [Streptomyces sp. NPDC050211]|uniref:hypothetical protein n=1 Tax=Streptomyces sp. NPDC050211 TaxID=3154932 RepID=UPI0034269DEF
MPPSASPAAPQRLNATPRGARLARRLTALQLAAWGHPYDSGVNRTAQQLVAELAANAVTHGRVPGRGLILVSLLALTWGVAERDVGKTVGVELALKEPGL